MTVMRVLVEELICQAVMGQIPVLECLFVRSALAPVAMSYHARQYMLPLFKDPALAAFPGTGKALGVTAGGPGTS
jgi:hypothetical protein